MLRKIEIRHQAERDLRAIPTRDAKRIAKAIMSLGSGTSSAVKKLTNFSPEYRLRVGDWRVLFDIAGDKIIIFRILNRKDAYRN